MHEKGDTNVADQEQQRLLDQVQIALALFGKYLSVLKHVAILLGIEFLLLFLRRESCF